MKASFPVWRIHSAVHRCKTLAKDFIKTFSPSPEGTPPWEGNQAL